MIDEIEELWSLADECRTWEKAFQPRTGHTVPTVREVEGEFRRLASRLDEIAKDLAARMPT